MRFSYRSQTSKSEASRYFCQWSIVMTLGSAILIAQSLTAGLIMTGIFGTMTAIAFVLFKLAFKKYPWECEGLIVNQKCIRKAKFWTFKTVRTIDWKDAKQMRFVPERSGRAKYIGTVFISSKEMTEEEWEKEIGKSLQTIDILVLSDREKNIIFTYAQKIKPDIRIMESENEKQPGIDFSNSEDIRINAAGRKALSEYGSYAVILIILGIILLFMEDGGSSLSWLGIVCFILAVVLILASRMLIYYKVDDKGITKYVYPGIKLSHTDWDDIMEAGYNKKGGVYISVISQDQRIIWDADDSLSWRKGIVACSSNLNRKLESQLKRYVPAEKWIPDQVAGQR